MKKNQYRSHFKVIINLMLLIYNLALKKYMSLQILLLLFGPPLAGIRTYSV